MRKRTRVAVTLLIIVAFLATGAFFYNMSLKKREEAARGNWYDNLIFKNTSFIYEFVRAIGYSYYKGADIGECIETARRIKDGDIYSWYTEWLKTAGRLHKLARKFERSGNVLSAREAYFRASNYYRSAGFYLHSKANLPKSLKSWKRSRECFLKAISSLSSVEVVKIPYENTTLPGYFVKTKNTEEKPPLLIVHTGFDGTGEELYFAVAQAATERGYNCLIFEGPGQGEVIRIQKIPFRPNWEKVVTPVVDYALTRPEVDKDKIALMGLSMGGYLAPRAVTVEHRIKACIANGGVFDFSENIYNGFPEELKNLLNTDPEKFNSEIKEAMKEDTEIAWFFNNGIWTFGVNTPAELMKAIKKYTLRSIVKEIKCHMLVINSEADMFFKGQPEKLYKELDCPKDYITFTKKEAAEAHCQVGAVAISNEVVFNWLDKVMK
ncbi:alpha/beta hydrolase family protein [Candidatus Omnitrophota bacterium]